MITSSQNPLVKEIIALRESKNRRQTGLTLVDGVREAKRAMSAGIKIEKLLHCPKFIADSKAAEALIKKAASTVEVSEHVFEKLAYGDRVDGVIAVVKSPLTALGTLKLSNNPLIVVLEAVEKPGNLGAILRTCAGAGVEAVLVGDPKTDIYNPNVIRASVGAVFALPVVAAANQEIAVFLRAKKIQCLGTFVDGRQAYTAADFRKPTAIVLGTEDEGLSAFWQDQCDVKVKIPMKSAIDSLNVSVSAAVVIYEALRQRS